MVKSHTDIEQSKKLQEILPIGSADMGLHYSCDPNAARNQMWVGTRSENADIPCWSLAALLGLILTNDKKDEYYVKIESHSDYHSVSYINCWDGCVHSEYSKESLLDACYEMILKLHKQKLL